MTAVVDARWAGRPDLSSDDFWTAPIPERADALARLRRREPVAHFREPGTYGAPDGPGYWALTRMDDVLAVGRSPELFINGHGYTISDMPPEFSQFFGILLTSLDAPRHTRLRRIVSRGFTPRRMNALRDYVADLSRRIVDEVIDTGGCDAVTAIAAPLPLKIICEMMGVPASQYDFVVEQTNIIFGSTDPEFLPEGSDPLSALIQAGMELSTLIRDLGEYRRAHPTDDLTSVLVNAEIDGEVLTPEELSGFFNLLVGAGNETTRHAICWGLHLLTENPEQRAAWLADLDTVTPTAVEEILRLSSPGIYMRRTLAADAVVGGQPMHAGEKVAMFYWAANRDPACFPDPDAFDVRRTPNQHIAFGHGPHFCLGAHLARREIAVLFHELLTRIPDIHTTAEPDRLASNFINGIKRLPVAFTPRRS